MVHTDCEPTLKLSLKEKEQFIKLILHTYCYFHFSKEILRNIEMVYFIKANKIKEFISLLYENLKNNEKTLKLYNFLKKIG